MRRRVTSRQGSIAEIETDREGRFPEVKLMVVVLKGQITPVNVADNSQN